MVEIIINLFFEEKVFEMLKQINYNFVKKKINKVQYSFVFIMILQK